MRGEINAAILATTSANLDAVFNFPLYTSKVPLKCVATSSCALDGAVHRGLETGEKKTITFKTKNSLNSTGFQLLRSLG